LAAESKTAVPGSSIIDFHLPATDGQIYSPGDFDDANVLVIIFMCNHCPYVKAVVPRLVQLQKKFPPQDVRLIAINPNDDVSYPEDSFDNMKLFAKEYGINFTYLRDESQETARSYDAVCTPDIYVYNRDRKLCYRGRIDDNWKDESAVTSKDLERAIELLLAGKEIDFPQVHSIGCSIKWKR
jgi:peroxiredoxin